MPVMYPRVPALFQTMPRGSPSERWRCGWGMMCPA
jgi:hypothetical protein